MFVVNSVMSHLLLIKIVCIIYPKKSDCQLHQNHMHHASDE